MPRIGRRSDDARAGRREGAPPVVFMGIEDRAAKNPVEPLTASVDSCYHAEARMGGVLESLPVVIAHKHKERLPCIMESTHAKPSPFSGTSVEDCYQCGKCTAGCPMAEQMDLMPNQLFRLVQLGQVDKAMRSEAIWLCVSCFTCTARCPQSVDCVGIMDALRQVASEKGVTPPAQERIRLFQQAFLDNIRKNGRVNEVELIQQFKMKGFFTDFSVPMLMKDATLAPKLLQRGKFHLFGEKVRDREVVQRIFDRCSKHTLADQVASTEGSAS